ncbi:MAG: hypothetical protein JSR17_08580 [Proteobacteria bacterium]|nr:hypothetical protein [Pseudomonadota bacterium]
MKKGANINAGNNLLQEKAMADKLVKEAEGFLFVDNVSAALNCYTNATRINPCCTAAYQGIAHCEMLIRTSINTPEKPPETPSMKVVQQSSASVAPTVPAANSSGASTIRPDNIVKPTESPAVAAASSSSSTMRPVCIASAVDQPSHKVLTQQNSVEQVKSQIAIYKNQLEILNCRALILTKYNDRLRKDIENLKSNDSKAPQNDQRPAEKKARHRK